MLRYIIPIIFLSITPLTTVNAQEVCGEPIKLRQMGDAEKFCSVYERQLAYREERLKFRQQIEERREDYIAPYHEALKKYEEDIKALNEERSHDNDVVGK